MTNLEKHNQNVIPRIILFKFLSNSAVCLLSAGLSLAVSVFVCVTFSVNVCCQVAKFLRKKNNLYGLGHLKSNGASPVLLLLDVAFHFRGKSFGIFLTLRSSRKR